MAKLNPPYIRNSLPPFYSDFGNITFTIPFEMNRSVDRNSVYGFYVVLKKSAGATLIFEKEVKLRLDNDQTEFSFTVSELDDGFKEELLMSDQYKLQIAYLDVTGERGVLSGAAVIKYTSLPTVSIEGLSLASINNHKYTYTGLYSQVSDEEAGVIRDATEKVYSYEFILYHGTDTPWSTGELIHNSANDTYPYMSNDAATFQIELLDNENYEIEYKITTINGLKVNSPKYRIRTLNLISSLLQEDDEHPGLIIEPDEDNARNIISLKALPEDMVAGQTYTYTLNKYKYVENDNNPFTEHEELKQFSFTYSASTIEVIFDNLFIDYLIEQNVPYQYYIERYDNQGAKSQKTFPRIQTTDFEDMFLYDGERQLKIQFNPQVSSFKTDILESKLETIGSKYPYIFRNDIVAYKEFPINGLISYWSDNDKLFAKENEINQYLDDDNEFRTSTGTTNFNTHKYKTTDQRDYNFRAERFFKLKVLDWLNDGKPKLFKSAQEGNYIVRILNNSLNPEEQISRLIHSFSSTAYEIDTCNYENYLKYNLLTLDKIETPKSGSSQVIVAGPWAGTGTVVAEDKCLGFTVERDSEDITGLEFTINYINGSTRVICLDPDIYAFNCTIIDEEPFYDIIDKYSTNYIKSLTFDNGQVVPWVRFLYYQYESEIIPPNVLKSIAYSEIVDIPARVIVPETTDNLINPVNDSDVRINALFHSPKESVYKENNINYIYHIERDYQDSILQNVSVGDGMRYTDIGYEVVTDNYTTRYLLAENYTLPVKDRLTSPMGSFSIWPLNIIIPDVAPNTNPDAANQLIKIYASAKHSFYIDENRSASAAQTKNYTQFDSFKAEAINPGAEPQLEGICIQSSQSVIKTNAYFHLVKSVIEYEQLGDKRNNPSLQIAKNSSVKSFFNIAVNNQYLPSSLFNNYDIYIIGSYQEWMSDPQDLQIDITTFDLNEIWTNYSIGFLTPLPYSDSVASTVGLKSLEGNKISYTNSTINNTNFYYYYNPCSGKAYVDQLVIAAAFAGHLPENSFIPFERNVTSGDITIRKNNVSENYGHFNMYNTPNADNDISIVKIANTVDSHQHIVEFGYKKRIDTYFLELYDKDPTFQKWRAYYLEMENYLNNPRTSRTISHEPRTDDYRTTEVDKIKYFAGQPFNENTPIEILTNIQNKFHGYNFIKRKYFAMVQQKLEELDDA